MSRLNFSRDIRRDNNMIRVFVLPEILVRHSGATKTSFLFLTRATFSRDKNICIYIHIPLSRLTVTDGYTTRGD